MNSTLLVTFSTFALAHAGMTCLALAMARHHRQLRPTARPSGRIARTVWRLAGWGLLALSLGLSLHAWGAATGAAAWFGVASAVALLLILLLAYLPALTWRLGWMAAGLGLPAWLVAVSGVLR